MPIVTWLIKLSALFYVEKVTNSSYFNYLVQYFWQVGSVTMKLAKPYFTKKKVQSRLAIMEVMKDTSKEILYQELGLESIQRSRCYRKTCSFYSMFMNNKCHIFQTLFPRHYLSKEPATKIIYHFLVHNITFHRKHFLYLLSLNGTN